MKKETIGIIVILSIIFSLGVLSFVERDEKDSKSSTSKYVTPKCEEMFSIDCKGKEYNFIDKLGK